MQNKILMFIAALFLSASVSATPTINAAATIEMEVDGLVCAFCAQGIEKKLRHEAATAEVYVSLEHKLVAVGLKPEQDIADDKLKALLTEAGYTVKGIKRTQEPLTAIKQRTQAHE